MADVVYKVRVDLEQSSNFANLGSTTAVAASKLADMDKSVDKMGIGFKNLGSSMVSAFTGAIEKVASLGISLGEAGLAGALGLVTLGVVSLNRQLELSTIGIADLLNSTGTSANFPQAMKMSADLMNKMRSDAAALPGEFKDLERIFQMSAVSGLQHGRSSTEIEQMSSKAMAYGIGAAGITGPIIARELAAVLEGHATSANVFSRKLGIDAKEFNKLSYDERFEKVSELLKKHDEAIPYYERSFEGLFTSLIDKGKQLLTTLTNPLFERIKSQMGQTLSWLNENWTMVDGWSQRIGGTIADMWDYGTQKIKEWGPKFLGFIQEAKNEILNLWAFLEPLFEKLGGVIKNTLSNPEGAFSGLKSVGALYTGAKLADMAGGGLTGVAGVAGLGESFVILAPAAITLAGAFDILTDSSNKLHGSAVENVKDTNENMKNAWDSYKSAWSRLEGPIKKVADELGDNFLRNLNYASFALSKYLGAADGFLNWMGLGKTRDPQSFERTNPAAGSIKWDQDGVYIELDEPSKNKNKDITGGGINVGKIEIIVNQTGDPSRVARAAVDRIADLQRYRKSSRFVTNYSVPR